MELIKLKSKFPMNFVQLAQTSDVLKCLIECKIFLELTSKKWIIQEFMSVFRFTGKCPPQTITYETQEAKKKLENYIQKTLKEKKCELSTETTTYFWKKKELPFVSGKWDTCIITKKTTILNLTGNWKKIKGVE
jgi:hypothetical protein